MNYLAVKDFQSFQHYKHRNPPWIKFYFGVLEDYSLLQLPEITQRHLFALWLVASRYDGFLPNDRKYLSTAIKARSRVDFEAMIASGFLTVVDEAERTARIAGCVQDASTDASKMLAESGQNAIASRARESQRQSQKAEKKQPEDASGDAAAAKNPWADTLRADWTDLTEGVISRSQIIKNLRPLITKHGEEETRARWREFAKGKDSRFGAAYFAKHFGNYRAGTAGVAPATAYAARLIRFYTEHGFSQVLPIEQHDARIDELAAEHKIKDPERVKRELRIVAPWMTLRGMKAGESGRYEERVAKLLHDAQQAAA